MERIWTLDLHLKGTDLVHPALLQDDSAVVLVDCGYPGSLEALERELERCGLGLNDVTHVVITHQDHDHMGALAALKRAVPGITVIAHEKEAPYIDGSQKNLRLVQAEQMQETLPGEQKAFGERFCRMLREVEPAPVDQTVKGGDWFPWCGGCEVVETPGHTPGHISLVLPRHRTWITGDAAVLDNGELVVANPQFALDLAKAERSLERIRAAKGEYELICYHGGHCAP